MSGTCGTGGWGGPLPGDPDNNSILTATPAFGGIDVSWTYPTTNPFAVAHTVVYRGLTDDPLGATIRSITGGDLFYDKTDNELSIEYFYWIKHVSINGTQGEMIGPASAIARPTIEQTMEMLANRIDTGMLGTALKADLGKITLLEGSLSEEVAARIASRDELIIAVGNLQGTIDEAITLVETEVVERTSDSEAFAASLNLVATGLGDSIAAVAVEMEALSTDTEAITSWQAVTEATLNGDVALGEIGLVAKVEEQADKTTAIGALYTAKLSVNGLIGGFGVYNDGTLVEAGFDVDNFWVGRTGPDKVKPFVIEGGEVFMDEAVINKLTFNKLRSADGNVIVEDGKIKAEFLTLEGLEVVDELGNVILGAGVDLDWARIGGSNKPADGATRNVARGLWASGTLYLPGDSVFKDGYGWSCIFEHTSSGGVTPPTYPVTENTYWVLQTIGGADGANGSRTAILDMYQWAAAAPTTFPVGTSTYTWATGQFTAPGTLNGWSLTPSAAVAGQTLWTCRTVFVDSLTSATSSVTWAATVARAQGAAGTPGSPGTAGANGANGARTAVLELYRWAAGTPVTFPSGSSTYTWNTGAFTAPATLNGWSLTPGAAVAGQTLWGCSVNYVDTGTSATSAVAWSTATAYALGAAGTNGANTILGLLSNEAHTVPTAADGSGGVFTGANTTLTIYNGATDDSANWTFAVTKVNVICTESSTSRTQTVTAMSADTGYVEFTASRAGYANIVKRFTLSKSKAGIAGSNGLDGIDGDMGPMGPAVQITSNRASTFTATDGTLDIGQSIITFTANTSGLTLPTYVWTFSGFEIAPTNFGVANQSVSAAQFGTAKSATVTCTVNGTYTDVITIVRLEKSTAQAGATVGAPAGTNVGGVPVETLVASVSAATTALTNKLNKAGDTITGRISLGVADGLFVGTDTNNGVYMGNGGLVSKKAGVTKFVLSPTGDALFAGSLDAASGTFAGTLTAAAVNAVDSINIKNNAVVVPVGAEWTGTFNGSSAIENRPPITSTGSFNSRGGSVLIIGSVTVRVRSSGSSGTAMMTIYRDGMAIKTITGISAPGGGTGQDGPSVTFTAFMIDNPGNGDHTYQITGWINSTNHRLTAASIGCMVAVKTGPI